MDPQAKSKLLSLRSAHTQMGADLGALELLLLKEDPPPQPDPPPPNGEFSLVTDSDLKTFSLDGRVPNWNRPLLFERLPFSGRLREAHIEIEFIVGQHGFGSTFFEFYKDKKKWKGDTILLLNYGKENRDNIAASHTLAGNESRPKRVEHLMSPHSRWKLTADLIEDLWNIFLVGSGKFLTMPIPPVTVQSHLGIQLGSHGDEFHETNDDCTILSFFAEFK
jgi:hypothetical protein